MTDDSELIVTQRGVSDRYPLHALVVVCRRQFSNVLFPFQQPSSEALKKQQQTPQFCYTWSNSLQCCSFEYDTLLLRT